MGARILSKLLFFILSVLSLNTFAVIIAGTDSRSVAVNSSYTIDVLRNDRDSNDDASSDRLRIVSVSTPENGTAVINPGGGIQYTPNADYIGPDTFIYTVADNSNPEETAEGTVQITVVQRTIGSALERPNIVGVGESLDSICAYFENTSDGELAPGPQSLSQNCSMLRALINSDPDAARDAIQQISPEETLALSRVGSNATQFQSDVVGGRMLELSGASSPNVSTLYFSEKIGGSAGDGIAAKFGVFASIQLEDADKELTVSEAGFDYSATALTIGADYALGSDWFIGGAFGWTGNELDYKNQSGTVVSDIMTFIGFATFNQGNFSIDTQVGMGNSSIDISRRINYGGTAPLDMTTKGETSGSQWFVNTQVQYLYATGAITLYPMAKLNYASSEVDGYADNEAGGWEVILGDQASERLDFEAGVQGTYAMNFNWGVLVPNFELNLITEINSEKNSVTGRFAYAPEDALGFQMNAEDPDSMYYQAGLGFSVILPKGQSGFVGYQSTLGYDNFKSSQIQAGFRMEF